MCPAHGEHGRRGQADQAGQADVSTVQNSSTHSAAKGKPGIAISPTVLTRNRSQTIITRRRGKRSARPDSSGDLSELVTGEGEDLGAPQRTELADGEDLATGRPRLGCPPVATQVTDLAFVPGPGLAGLGTKLRRHGLASLQASARVPCGVWSLSPSRMQPQVVQ